MGGDVRLNEETFGIEHKAGPEEACKEVKSKGGKVCYVAVPCAFMLNYMLLHGSPIIFQRVLQIIVLGDWDLHK